MTDRDDDRDERTREEIEEEEYERETFGDLVPDINQPIRRVSAALVRDWVRATIVPKAVRRMAEIGMGITRFEVPTMAGNTVRVPAPSSVQQRALAAVISIGVPQQLGLTGEGGELPGVIALGPLELDEARREAHQARGILPTSGGIEVFATEGVAPGAGESPKLASEGSTPSAPVYVAPEGHTIVEVEENGVTNDTRADVPPPPPPTEPTLAQKILARRRAARSHPNGNGAH